MRRMALAAVLVTLANGTAHASAPLEPSSAWNVSYEEAQCTASRTYGPADKPITLTLVPSVTGSAMRILFVRDGKTSTDEQLGELTLGSLPPIKTYAFVYDVPSMHHRVHSVIVPMTEFRAAAAASSVGLRAGSLDVTLKTDEIPDMLVELDKCLKDLQDYWNVKNIGPARVAPNPGKALGLVSGMDYPGLAIIRGQTGTVGMTLLIDEKGQVADCTVEQPSGAAVLDVASCFLVQTRAKFLPAMDSKGKPMRSAVSQRISWRIQN